MKMKTIQLFILSSVILLTIVFTSCEKSDDVKTVSTSVQVNLPSTMQDVTADELKVVFLNKTNNSTSEVSTDKNGKATATIEEGVYDISVSGNKTYTFTNSDGSNGTQTVKLSGSKSSVGINGTLTTPIEISVVQSVENKGWVIKEVYFTGTRTSAEKAYSKDQFIEVYNNSDETLYADGITIAQTINLATNEVNLYASDIDQYTYVNTVYTIPGSGKEHPVEPGKSILIAPTPINHKADVPNSFDLSIADYQWYDENAQAVDVPEVPNLDRHYSYSKTIWILHTGGSNSFVIFRVDDQLSNMDKFVEDNLDERLNTAGNKAYAVKVDNKYILDAVQTGNKGKLASKSLSASLDMGFTFCSETLSTKSIRRKVAEVKEDGRVVYQDSNNSTVDFYSDADPQPKIFK